MEKITPKSLQYHFPAEWEKHDATWLTYPHNENSWPGTIHRIFPFYNEFIRILSTGEIVHILLPNEENWKQVEADLSDLNAHMQNIRFHLIPSNDAWTRDHGPAFVINRERKEKAMVNWEYNGWGSKYPADIDNQIPGKLARWLNMPLFSPGIVMEGGSVDFNGKGTLVTTTACLLNPNRNPSLNQEAIEQYLCEYYGVEQIWWLGEGIEGDDTDGHIDDITRFVSPDTLITMVEPNTGDPNHMPLQLNLKTLKKLRLLNGKQPEIVEIPMPQPVYYENQRLPASYANFYLANAGLIVPTYRCKEDQIAIDILSQVIKDRPVIGIDSTEIIWGLGSWHCLSQQEPSLDNQGL